jgi:hypothetical protein
MRLPKKPLGFVVNFLLGVSWAIAAIGALSSFLSFYHYGIFYAVVWAFIGLIPGLIAVLLLEHFITSQEKLAELRKQTELLEKLNEKSHRS